MPRTLAELTACAAQFRKFIAAETRWELCASCTVKICNPKAVGCKCRQHMTERKKAAYWANPEKYRRRSRLEYQNPEVKQKAKERKRKYQQEAREVIVLKERERYHANPAKKLAAAKRYHAANREAIIAKHKAYREANRDLIRAKAKEYRERNKEELKRRRKASSSAAAGLISAPQ